MKLKASDSLTGSQICKEVLVFD